MFVEDTTNQFILLNKRSNKTKGSLNYKTYVWISDYLWESLAIAYCLVVFVLSVVKIIRKSRLHSITTTAGDMPYPDVTPRHRIYNSLANNKAEQISGTKVYPCYTQDSNGSNNTQNTLYGIDGKPTNHNYSAANTTAIESTTAFTITPLNSNTNLSSNGTINGSANSNSKKLIDEYHILHPRLSTLSILPYLLLPLITRIMVFASTTYFSNNNNNLQGAPNSFIDNIKTTKSQQLLKATSILNLIQGMLLLIIFLFNPAMKGVIAMIVNQIVQAFDNSKRVSKRFTLQVTEMLPFDLNRLSNNTSNSLLKPLRSLHNRRGLSSRRSKRHTKNKNSGPGVRDTFTPGRYIPGAGASATVSTRGGGSSNGMPSMPPIPKEFLDRSAKGGQQQDKSNMAQRCTLNEMQSQLDLINEHNGVAAKMETTKNSNQSAKKAGNHNSVAESYYNKYQDFHGQIPDHHSHIKNTRSRDSALNIPKNNYCDIHNNGLNPDIIKFNQMPSKYNTDGDTSRNSLMNNEKRFSSLLPLPELNFSQSPTSSPLASSLLSSSSSFMAKSNFNLPTSKSTQQHQHQHQQKKQGKRYDYRNHDSLANSSIYALSIASTSVESDIILSSPNPNSNANSNNTRKSKNNGNGKTRSKRYGRGDNSILLTSSSQFESVSLSSMMLTKNTRVSPSNQKSTNDNSRIREGRSNKMAVNQALSQLISAKKPISSTSAVGRGYKL
ncbi:hypothetical protein H4219_004728 [Mycoemilia scoparia]|uniref:Uncharacterized protein n=1 Tax=Mycoemilia scoparia TaxID=417184 RepID=A0A9W8A076_9FUNG|nr:hypothetical protein H4219_004728 [Mycoemilia scoparia]